MNAVKKFQTSNQPDSVGPPLLNIAVLESSLAVLTEHGEAITTRFYALLFERHPEVELLFDTTSIAQQKKKLWAAIQLVGSQLGKPKALKKTLKILGKRHEGYGAKAAHYSVVSQVLLDVMAEFAGELWTPEVATAWRDALTVIAATMLDGYNTAEDTTMAKSENAVAQGSIEALQQELTQLRSSVDGAMTAIMMVDRDFKVTYVNQSTTDLLTKHQEVLSSIFPGFNASHMVGQSIDQFHKNPAHQRQLLSNPNNLPHQATIDVGPLKFALNVTAMVDDKGTYIGNTLEWSDVTEQRAQENSVARLQGAVDNAMTSIMMVDRDLVITYVNDSTITLLKKHEMTLKSVYRGFDADNMLGQCIDQFHANSAHQRKLLDDPRNLPYQTDINVGDLTFDLNVTAIMDTDGNYLGNCLEWSDVTEQRQKELDIARLESAVNGAQANLMICDKNFNITYLNPAVKNMMLNRQNELRQRFPAFNVNALEGSCIDQFHENPAHQRALLSDLSRLPARDEIDFGSVVFEINTTGIVDPEGNWMGNMVEWRDLTEQKDAETQVRNLIEAATTGDLDQQIDTKNYMGFMKGLGDGINDLMQAVVTPIREGTNVIGLLADGDLRKTMDNEYDGEFDVMKDALNRTVANLRDMVAKIQGTSTSISSGAAEIAQGNTDLSQRTEEQASSLEETASSIEELTGTVKQNADNANQANQLASGAREQAEKGGEVVQRAVHAMSAINTSSKKIADIIGVIDEIAFQTNLLALNAAVEAARAGEQGRGFAVVAGEVRNLAQRSAAAAKEIKSLIQDSVEKVDEGSRLVDESGRTLGEIVGSVKKVSDIIAEIAAASQEQSTGIDQVNKAITQMDEVTQQNAALVEQAAASSESMDEQAKGLVELMDFFTTDENTTSTINHQPAGLPAQNTNQFKKVVKKAPNREVSRAKKDDEWSEF